MSCAVHALYASAMGLSSEQKITGQHIHLNIYTYASSMPNERPSQLLKAKKEIRALRATHQHTQQNTIKSKQRRP